VRREVVEHVLDQCIGIDCAAAHPFLGVSHRGPHQASPEACQRLAQPGVESIVARCEPTNAASIRVLEKAGLARRAIEGPLLGWVAEPS